MQYVYFFFLNLFSNLNSNFDLFLYCGYKTAELIKNGNPTLGPLPFSVPVQIAANGIQETLPQSPFVLYLPSLIFLLLCKSPSSMCNPLWRSHVCWSSARKAWYYYNYRHHTRAHTNGQPIVTPSGFSPCAEKGNVLRGCPCSDPTWIHWKVFFFF